MHRQKLYAARLFAALLASAALTLPVTAPAADTEYAPHVGQEGKDVIWVPTPQALVDKMLDMAKLTARDVHFDLGSGDGRTVIAAAKRGAQAVGVEFNPDMVALSERAAVKEGVSAKAKFINGDIFQTDSFESRTAYLWIVPAKVEGTWQLPQGELTLKQLFQMVAGTLKTGGNTLTVNGKLRGDQISFTAGGAQYTGRVNGSAIEGSVKGGSSGNWKATRSAKQAPAPAKY